MREIWEGCESWENERERVVRVRERERKRGEKVIEWGG